MPSEQLKIHAFRLKPGQKLKEEIQAFANKEQIDAGWIMACIGSLTQTHLRLANESIGNRASGPFEIVSLVGA